MMNRRYGWIPDLPDKRDLYCRYHPATLAVLPPRKDLRQGCPAIYDQGDLGSCTANAIGGAHQFEQLRQSVKGSGRSEQKAAKNAKTFQPSRLFIYFNERVIEGTIGQDSGANIRDGMKSVAKQGVCRETLRPGSGQAAWPYDISKFTKRPPTKCYQEALQHQVLQYRRLDQILSQLKACLASGHPFVFGFTVYESFESASVAKVGIVPMPGRGEKVLGGHAVLAVGYIDTLEWFIVRNSWSAKWGDKGYCYMPYAYLTDTDLASDFWVMTMVEAETTSALRQAQGYFADAKQTSALRQAQGDFADAKQTSALRQAQGDFADAKSGGR